MAAQTDLTVVIRAINEATGALKEISGDFKNTFGIIGGDAKKLGAIFDEISNGLRDSLKGSLDPKAVDQIVNQFNRVSADGIQKFLKQTKEGGKEAGGVLGSIQEALEGIGKTFRTITTLGGATLLYHEIVEPLFKLVEGFAETAARSQEAERGMYNVGIAAGFSKTQIAEAAKTLEDYGATGDVAARSLQKLFSAGVSPEQSQQLAATARAMAQSFGKPFEEVYQSVLYSVERGTTRYLQVQYGLAVNAQLELVKKSRELGRQVYEDEKRSIIADAIAQKGATQFPSQPESKSPQDKDLRQLQDDLRVSADKLATSIGDQLLPLVKDLAVSFKETADLLRESFVPQMVGSIANAIRLADRLQPVRLGLALIRYELEKIRQLPSSTRGHGEGPFTGNVGVGGDFADASGGNAGAAAAAAHAKQIREERAEQDKKLELAKQKALDEITLNGLKTRLSIVQQGNAQAEALDKESYDRATISLAQYYANRAARTQKEYQAERAVQLQTIRNADAEVERLKKQGGEAFLRVPEAQTKAAEARQQLAVIDAKNATARTADTVKQTDEEIKLTRALEDQIDTQRTAADSHDLQAALDQLQHKYQRLRETLNDVDGAQTRQLYTQEAARKRYEVFKKTLDDTAATEDALLAVQRAQINTAFEKGQITSVEKQNALNDALSREITIKRQALAAEYQYQAANAEDERAQQQRVLKLSADIETLEGQYQTLAKTIRTQFISDLASAYASLFSRAKSLKESLLDLGRATANQLLQIATKNLAEQTVKVLIDSTGAFESLGKLLGDRGTPYNPQWVDFSPRLQAWLEGVLSAQGASSGAGGLLGLLGFGGSSGGGAGAAAGAGEDAGIVDLLETAADGGAVVGPSHAGGGVNINAEGGEFIVNKQATARYSGLLNAINAGFADTFSFVSPRRVFADGGPVVAGAGSGGGTTNNIKIEINDGLASANGDSVQAAKAARRLSEVVQSEVLKMKRPGGMLNP